MRGDSKTRTEERPEGRDSQATDAKDDSKQDFVVHSYLEPPQGGHWYADDDEVDCRVDDALDQKRCAFAAARSGYRGIPLCCNRGAYEGGEEDGCDAEAYDDAHHGVAGSVEQVTWEEGDVKVEDGEFDQGNGDGP